MAKHTPPGDRSFALSLTRHLGAAVALILVVAAAFWGISQVQPDEGGNPVVAGSPSGPGDGTDDDASVSDTGPESDQTGVGAGDPGTPTQPTPEDSPAAETKPTVEPTPPPAVPTPTPDPTPDETEPEPAPAGGQNIAPAEISVQVLDAVIDDGGQTARDVASRLSDDGYRVVATNKAVRRYDVTTVFYTAGNQAKARQIAAVYGFSRVEAQPGNLSESVDVHLVVGADA